MERGTFDDERKETVEKALSQTEAATKKVTALNTKIVNAGYATKSQISNGTLYQVLGSLNSVDGRFEWAVQNNYVTHRLFVRGGSINGRPIIP